MHSKNGYLSGMPRRLRVWLVVAVFYYTLAGIVFLNEPLLGALLLLLPAFWTLAKNWVLGNVFLTSDVERSSTLFGYTVDYLFDRASRFTRTIVGTLFLLAVALGLGWVSTEDLRLKAAEPTLTERVTGAANAYAKATKETTAGWATATKRKAEAWVSTAKGWFSDESGPEPE